MARADARPERIPVTAAVLAGGASRRMGTDKRVLVVGGKTMLSRVLEAAGGVCERTMIVVARNDSRLDHGALYPGVTVVHDRVTGAGPIAGLVTALDRMRDEWLLAVAADTPFLEPDVIRLLWSRRSGGRAVVAVGPRGREPLLALYHRDCLPVAESLLGTCGASPRRVLDLVETVDVGVDVLRTVDPDLRSLVNINTPLEYANWETTDAAGEPQIPVVSVVGRSGSGKTTLLEKLIAEVTRRGYRVATIKHHAHDTDIDVPGKDSWRHARAGAREVVLKGERTVAVFKELEAAPTLDDLIRLIDHADLVFAEGFHHEGRTLVEVSRVECGHTLLHDPSRLFALVTDRKAEPGGPPTFGLEEHEALADLIERSFLGRIRIDGDQR